MSPALSSWRIFFALPSSANPPPNAAIGSVCFLGRTENQHGSDGLPFIRVSSSLDQGEEVSAARQERRAVNLRLPRLCVQTEVTRQKLDRLAGLQAA